MTEIAELETPVPLVDLDRLTANLDRAANYARNHNLALRPHVKTHKSIWVAGEQLARGAAGLTCATPFEAVTMASATPDILVAFPPIGRGRIAHLQRLPQGTHLTIALDSLEGVRGAAEIARAIGPVDVYVELDVGMRRVGTSQIDDAIAIARTVSAEPSLRFAGLAFYPGHIRSADRASPDLPALNATLEEAVARFTDAGLPPRVVSGGSTPTLWQSHALSRMTEIRCGTYVFNDRATIAAGACTPDECALSVLATVVSVSVPGQAVIDAGTKALGREPLSASDSGFGCIADRPEIVVSRMSEEHGILDLSTTAWRPRVGEQLRIVPNHACIVTHLNDVVAGVRSQRVESFWRIDARGRGYDQTE